MNETNNPHSVANFNPAEYSVVDYLDNQRPRYMGGPVEYYEAAVKRWEEEITHYFPHWRTACSHPTLDQYGSLSERQVECLIESLERDTARVSRKAQDEAEKAALLAAGVRAPEGRKTVEGTVLSTRAQESQFGIVCKWLVKLTDGTKVWTSIPTGLGFDELKGKQVRFTATFEISKDDQLFAFGKRPTKATVLAKV